MAISDPDIVSEVLLITTLLATPATPIVTGPFSETSTLLVPFEILLSLNTGVEVVLIVTTPNPLPLLDETIIFSPATICVTPELTEVY